MRLQCIEYIKKGASTQTDRDFVPFNNEREGIGRLIFQKSPLKKLSQMPKLYPKIKSKSSHFCQLSDLKGQYTTQTNLIDFKTFKYQAGQCEQNVTSRKQSKSTVQIPRLSLISNKLKGSPSIWSYDTERKENIKRGSFSIAQKLPLQKQEQNEYLKEFIFKSNLKQKPKVKITQNPETLMYNELQRQIRQKVNEEQKSQFKLNLNINDISNLPVISFNKSSFK